jgi:NADH-quinone oxidoreductase subunit L
MDPTTLHSTGETLKWLLTIAWLLPLLGFSVEIFAGWWGGRHSKTAAQLAVTCIVIGFICSFSALIKWGCETHWAALSAHGDSHAAGEHSGDAHATDAHAADSHAATEHTAPASAEPHDLAVAAKKHGADAAHTDAHAAGHEEFTSHAAAGHDDVTHAPGTRVAFTGVFYRLARFGTLDISLSYYIDSLTLVMFTMVTFIASCIHLFAMGYMADELTDNYEDHQVHTSHGHLHRPGRFYRFFAFLSLFCFSMLGLVLAGNIFQVFIFWELVGVCSYFLIGFYTERKSASSAANKAFIMNRVGDFGFLIGLMIVWTWFGTFQFGELPVGKNGHVEPGLFAMARGTDGQLHLHVPESGVTEVVFKNQHNQIITDANGEQRTIPYYLLIAEGLGVFGGCIGKSAQFPLQTWLPDAMEGPTPVSALVHSATMVAAGVYLVGRFYPMFTPEVLLTIAYIGCITLFMAATIAVVATDIKKVLAYSTISQLGYMMLGLGLGGWAAGLFHLITHAFFKSLMFLCSGSVIYGCHHVQEMPQMGGLRRKMPFTAYTMLIGVIAIAGLAVPFVTLWGEPIAFSGYHSKDAVVATALTYTKLNGHPLLFIMPLCGAGITAFYMFRLWFYTFAGKPRDQHVYDHAHESPWIMVLPLCVLSFFAAFCAFGGESGILFRLLSDSEPTALANGSAPTAEQIGEGLLNIKLPSHAQIHANHAQAGLLALIVAFSGAFAAYICYGARWINPAEIKAQFSGLHQFLVNKWGFDELYDIMFVRPSHVVAGWCSAFDRIVFDGFLHGCASAALKVSAWDRQFDETIVDGAVNAVGSWTNTLGRSLSVVQTGRMRNYVMFIAVGLLGVFAALIAFFPNT